MRAKDAIEVANVLGRARHAADAPEFEGLDIAWKEFVGYVEHRYPEIDQDALNEAHVAACEGRWFQ